jgi:hypothetical protein
MDLNLQNYSIQELLTVFNLSDIKDPTAAVLQKALYDKVESITNASDDDLCESKDNLISFYTQGHFKILQSLHLSDPANTTNFISVQEGLLPPLNYNYTNQQSSRVVSVHDNSNPLPTWHTTYKEGTVNPIDRTSYKQLLNINTRFRENYKTTFSTDCQFKLPETIKKVVSMQLKEVQIPLVVYGISDHLGSNQFTLYWDTTSIADSENIYNDRIAAGDTPEQAAIASGIFVIKVPSGSYGPNDLAAVITRLLYAVTNSQMELHYFRYNGTMAFYGQRPFFIRFDYDKHALHCATDTKKIPPPAAPNTVDSIMLTLGWILGFRGNALYKQENEPDFSYNGCLYQSLPSDEKKTVCELRNYHPDHMNIDNIQQGQGPTENAGIEYWSITGDACYDKYGTAYFYLCLDDFNNNHPPLMISAFKDQTLGEGSILGKIPTDCFNYCCDQSVPRIYFGPVDLTKFHIKLIDEYGRPVDLNNCDFSFTLVLDKIYDL